MSNFAVTFSVARSAHFARDKTTNGYSFRRTFEFRRIFLGFDKPRGGIRHSPLLAQASSSVGISRGRTSSARTLGVGSKLEALKFGLYDREDFVTADCCSTAASNTAPASPSPGPTLVHCCSERDTI